MMHKITGKKKKVPIVSANGNAFSIIPGEPISFSGKHMPSEEEYIQSPRRNETTAHIQYPYDSISARLLLNCFDVRISFVISSFKTFASCSPQDASSSSSIDSDTESKGRWHWRRFSHTRLTASRFCSSSCSSFRRFSITASRFSFPSFKSRMSEIGTPRTLNTLT